MDYSTLVAGPDVKGSIQYWINYSRIDSESILEEAQAWIYRKLRTRDLLAIADIEFTTGLSVLDFPEGYLDPIQLGIPGWMNRLRLKDAEWLRSHLGFDQNGGLPEGLPTYWADIDKKINLNTKMDQTYAGKMAYFRRPANLSSGTPTNFLTDKYPTLLRRTCLLYAAEARKEYDLYDRLEVRVINDVKDIMSEDDLAKRGMELDFNWEEN